MPFDVDGAKKAGYSDDEIQSHLKSIYPKFNFDSARKAGYSLNEISNHLTKGGEQNNEEQIRNQPQADSDRNAGREANQQEPPVGSEANVQANVQLRPEDQGQRQRNDQADLTNEGQTEDAQGGIQGSKEGQSMGSPFPTGDKEEVAKGSVPSAPVVPTITRTRGAVDKLKEGDIKGAAGDVMESIGRELSPLLGPTQQQKFEESVPVKQPDGSVKYEFKPAASKFEQEGLLGIKFGEAPKLEPNAEDSVAKATGKAVFNTISSLGEFMTTPLGAATAGLGAAAQTSAAAAKLAKPIAGAFSAQMLSAVPEQIGQAIHGKTTQERVEGFLGALTGLGFGGLAAKHALEPIKIAPPEVVQNVARQAAETGLPETAAELAKPTEVPQEAPIPTPTAEAPAEAQPTALSETKEKVQEAGRIPTVEGEPPVGEAEVKVEERTPQGERKGEERQVEPKGEERLVHAAFKPDPNKPEVFYGANHDEALDAAHKAGAITDEYKEQMSGNKNAANRNTENFGYWTDKNRFVNRKEGYNIGKESDQLIRDKFDFESKEGVDLHSHEVVLDEHPLGGKIDAEQFHGKTVRNVLYNLSKDKNVHPAFREMANVLRRGGFLRDLQDLVISTDEVGEGKPSRGSWTSTGYVFLPKGEPVKLKTVFHEILHSHTSNQIGQFVKESGKTGKDYYNALLEARGDIKTPKELKNLIGHYLKVVDHAGLTDEIFSEGGHANSGERMRELKDRGAMYGHTSLHEFISETFTNPDFQDLLKSIPYDKKFSMWDKILESLSKMLKIPQNSLAYDVMKSSLDLSKRPSYLEKRGAPSLEGFYKEKEAYRKQQEAAQVPNQLEPQKDKIEEIGAEAPPPTSADADSWWDSAKKKSGMFMEDMKALGVPGAEKYAKEQTKNLFQKTASAVSDAADSLAGVTLKKLRNAGVFLEGVQHAYSTAFIDPWVHSTIAEVFPDKYKISEEGKAEIADADYKAQQAQKKLDIEEYRGVPQKGMTQKEYEDAKDSLRAKVDAAKLEAQLAKEKHDQIRPIMDVIVKDNILGGYDEINSNIESKTKELDALKEKMASGAGDKSTKSEITALEQNIEDLQMASKAITDAHDIEKYAKDVEAAKGTEIEQDINRWKEMVHPMMDELYRKANNTDFIPPTERGRVFGARVNLLSQDDAKSFIYGADKDEPIQSVIGSEYRNPDIKADVLAKKAAFNSKYSTDIEAILKNSFAMRYREGTKLDFYKSLIKRGEAVLVDRGDPPPTGKWAGEKIKKMDISDWPEYDEATGRVKRTEKVLYLPNELYPEVNQVLDASLKPEKNKLFDSLTAIQLAAPTDAIVHSKNLLAVATTALGRDSAYSDIINKIPILNSRNAIVEIRNVMKELEEDSPKIRKEKAEIGKMAGLRPHYEVEGGLLRILSKPQHEFLYKTDLAVRLILNRRMDNLVRRGLVEDTPEARADFVNQVGEYNRKVMARWESSLREVGLSPFIVAGRAMNRMGRRLVTLDPGFKPKDKKAAIEARLIQVSGLAMAALVPALINLVTTKSMWGRPGTPIGAIDFGPNFDTKDGKHRGFDFFQLMNIRRGARQLGIDAALNGIKDGLPFNQISQNILDDAKVVSLHPFVGPGIGFIAAAAFGERLDLRSGFQGMSLSRKIEGPLGVVEKARVALKQQNQFLYNLGLGWGIEKGMEAFGIPRPSSMEESATLRDLGLPQHVPIFRQLYDVGVTAVGAAGGRMYVSPAMKLVSQLGKHVPYSPKDDLRYQYRKGIMEAMESGKGEEVKKLWSEGIEKGVLTKADMKTISQKQKYPDLLVQRTIRNITSPEDAISVYRIATPDEQDKIDRIIYKKIANSTKTGPADRKAFIEAMNEFAKKGSMRYKAQYPNQ
jgi:hypothetical protein